MCDIMNSYNGLRELLYLDIYNLRLPYLIYYPLSSDTSILHSYELHFTAYRLQLDTSGLSLTAYLLPTFLRDINMPGIEDWKLPPSRPRKTSRPSSPVDSRTSSSANFNAFEEFKAKALKPYEEYKDVIAVHLGPPHLEWYNTQYEKEKANTIRLIDQLEEDVTAEHHQKIRQQQDKWKAERGMLEAKHHVQVEQIQRDYHVQVEQIQRDYRQELERLREEHDQEQDDAKYENEQLRSENEAHQSTVKSKDEVISCLLETISTLAFAHAHAKDEVTSCLVGTIKTLAQAKDKVVSTLLGTIETLTYAAAEEDE